MIIFFWILIVCAVCAAIALTVYSVGQKRYHNNMGVTYNLAVRLVVTWIICVAFSGLLIWFMYFTETGKRGQKSLESNTSGGLNRTVKVYDMQGELIAEYKGKFDVAESATEGITKVKFDCDGKRHIIYGSTGTIIIDEE